MMILHPLKWNRRVRTLKAVEEEDIFIGLIKKVKRFLTSAEFCLANPTDFNTTNST